MAATATCPSILTTTTARPPPIWSCVATPWEGVLSTVAALEAALAGKIVISMANALTRWGKDMVPLLPPTGSVTVAVARALPAIAGRRVRSIICRLDPGPTSTTPSRPT